ncbi:SIR2 family NAD-dependent protein deacylase [Caenispirillum bisanense]|uniref:SIR2-like domain-containing protein n=1 Tax=Caenispirillum bisanense TaxID=414052 RepID=A0A286GEM4_9PROT|nr:SIR2 family protein [Caenispirillum bisanense]SOD93967.1 SIR2-like domain-containing protein [Caenispirillum bisanense]
MTAPLTAAAARDVLLGLRDDIAAGRLIPYLGPDLLVADGQPASIPVTTRGLADRLNAKVAVPGRIRGNMWSVAQYIESRRHRQTLMKLLAEIFGPAVAPTPLHHWLAGLPGLPLIIDTWYDGAMAAALAEARPAAEWGQIQGVTRNGEWRDIWRKTFDAAGTELEDEGAAAAWQTVLYKPHGSVAPAANYLISDSDYVEVLTEIDIQSPIPPLVKDLRTTRGFVFLGCRFYDQMLRTYARQIMKRSVGPYYAVLAETPTKNEEKFFAELGIQVLALPLAEAAAVLAGEVAAAA